MAQHSMHTHRPPSVPTQTVQEAPTPPSRPLQQETVTLVLRPRKKVSWDAKTVDNEHMQKKSSKLCCVFHKKELSSSDDEDGEGRDSKKKGHCHHDGDEHDGSQQEEGTGKGKGHCHHQGGEVAESSGKSEG